MGMWRGCGGGGEVWKKKFALWGGIFFSSGEIVGGLLLISEEG